MRLEQGMGWSGCGIFWRLDLVLEFFVIVIIIIKTMKQSSKVNSEPSYGRLFCAT